MLIYSTTRSHPRPGEWPGLGKNRPPPPSRDLKGVIRFCPGKWALGRSKGFETAVRAYQQISAGALEQIDKSFPNHRFTYSLGH